MFQTGDFVVYGRTGVCRVEGIQQGEKGMEYYALTPLYQNCWILAPVNGKVFMRSIISREEAQALIDALPTFEAKAYESKGVRELTEHYQTAIATHDCGELFRLNMSIYAKKKTAQREKKKFGAIDERFMKEGEALLYGELAAALDIPIDEVQSYIAQRLSQAAAAGGAAGEAVEV